MALDVRTPGRPTRARPSRRRFFHGGAVSMIIIATVLALVVAFVATYVYAEIDSNKSERTTTTVAQTEITLSPTVPPDQTTTTVKQLTEEELDKKIAASVRAVQTRDPAGQPSNGTAFVVGSFGGQTLLLTSFEVVRANTRAPGPGITLDGGRQATLWTWQENKDLALLVIGGAVESLPWASVAPKAGDKLYAGGAGQKASVGAVQGVSESGIEHNIFVDDVRRGAPLVNRNGEVLGMASKVYNPDGRGTDTLFTGIPIRAACERMLRCGGGNTTPEGSVTDGPSGSTTTTTR